MEYETKCRGWIHEDLPMLEGMRDNKEDII